MKIHVEISTSWLQNYLLDLASFCWYFYVCFAVRSLMYLWMNGIVICDLLLLTNSLFRHSIAVLHACIQGTGRTDSSNGCKIWQENLFVSISVVVFFVTWRFAFSILGCYFVMAVGIFHVIFPCRHLPFLHAHWITDTSRYQLSERLASWIAAWYSLTRRHGFCL